MSTFTAERPVKLHGPKDLYSIPLLIEPIQVDSGKKVDVMVNHELANGYGDIEAGQMQLLTDMPSIRTAGLYWLTDRFPLVKICIKAIKRQARDAGNALLCTAKAQLPEQKLSDMSTDNLKHHSPVNGSPKQIREDGGHPGTTELQQRCMWRNHSYPGNKQAQKGDMRVLGESANRHVDIETKQLVKSSRKEISTEMSRHIKEKNISNEVANSFQAHGVAHHLNLVAAFTPSTAASQVVSPLPPTASVPAQAVSHPSAPPSYILPISIPIQPTTAPPNSPLEESLNLMSVGQDTTSSFFNNEILRICFILIDILATAAISSMQGPTTNDSKRVRSLLLTANVCFAISFVTAFIGLSWTGILICCGNAYHRCQGSQIIKLSIVVTASLFMCLGVFVIIDINIERALL